MVTLSQSAAAQEPQTLNNSTHLLHAKLSVLSKLHKLRPAPNRHSAETKRTANVSLQANQLLSSMQSYVFDATVALIQQH